MEGRSTPGVPGAKASWAVSRPGSMRGTCRYTLTFGLDIIAASIVLPKTSCMANFVRSVLLRHSLCNFAMHVQKSRCSFAVCTSFVDLSCARPIQHSQCSFSDVCLICHVQSQLLPSQLRFGSKQHHMQKGTALPCFTAEACCSHPSVGVQEVLLQPHPVKRLKRTRGVSIHTPVVDVACGHWATYAVDEAGHVWAWGLNNYGQLGMPGQVKEFLQFWALCTYGKLLGNMQCHTATC